MSAIAATVAGGAGDPKWSDDSFLDRLRAQADPLADATVAHIIEHHGIQEVGKLFRQMTGSAQALDLARSGPLDAYFEQTAGLPPGFDPKIARRGGECFLDSAIPAAVVMLAYSMPAGYASPALTRILTISGDLDNHPYKRLAGVLQLLVNISVAKAFRPDGAGVLSAQKLRLLHAGIRVMVARYRPEYREELGVPVNHEDMLATIMGLSLLVVEGLDTLRIGMCGTGREDFYYLWKNFALMMGIHPEGKPHSTECIPQSLSEAQAFYDSYRRRHYVAASENPDGVRLSRDLERMMVRIIPLWMRALGFGFAPRILMRDLLGEEGMARTGLPVVRGQVVVGTVVRSLLRLFHLSTELLPRFLAAALGRIVFRDLIRVAWGKDGARYLVPDSIEDLHEL